MRAPVCLFLCHVIAAVLFVILIMTPPRICHRPPWVARHLFTVSFFPSRFCLSTQLDDNRPLSIPLRRIHRIQLHRFVSLCRDPQAISGVSLGPQSCIIVLILGPQRTRLKSESQLSEPCVWKSTTIIPSNQHNACTSRTIQSKWNALYRLEYLNTSTHTSLSFLFPRMFFLLLCYANTPLFDIP